MGRGQLSMHCPVFYCITILNRRSLTKSHFANNTLFCCTCKFVSLNVIVLFYFTFFLVILITYNLHSLLPCIALGFSESKQDCGINYKFSSLSLHHYVDLTV